MKRNLIFLFHESNCSEDSKMQEIMTLAIMALHLTILLALACLQ
jgi:hypothetical protein